MNGKRVHEDVWLVCKEEIKWAFKATHSAPRTDLKSSFLFEMKQQHLTLFLHE